MNPIRALSLTQPYAQLIVIGAKRIETRPWGTSHRGPLAIHAAAGLGPVGGKRGFKQLCSEEPFYSVLTQYMNQREFASLKDMVEHPLMPFGAVVAVCKLIACFRIPSQQQFFPMKQMDRSMLVVTLPPEDLERYFGDYTPGRYAWILADVRPFPQPIPAKGALGLWEWEPPEELKLIVGV